ncbi:MAG TPA: dihydrofolate reductase family protein, partial [Ilumatobacteraceae bacterium]|nr:dihydrofolate reductase family protein [Ilumatobacteraceae bacterium]
ETVRAGRGEIDLTAALARLPGSPHLVQAEGGPLLNGALAAADLIDEINLTLSPLVIGGDAERLTAHAPPVRHGFHLAHLIEHDSYLFARYVRA